MKRIATILFVCVTAGFSALNAQDAKTLQETARNFSKDGDFSNAVMVLSKAHELEPNNLAVSKDLALAYYQKSDYPKMQGVVKPLLERTDADPEVYQIGGMLNKAINDTKECERVYKKGLKSFPDNGALLSDYGELLWTKQDFNAIKYWEHGIQADPSYTGNYYNASRYYYFTRDKAWSLIYGEMFVNMESYSRRTVEIKGLLLEGYKKLYTDADMMKNQDTKNEFVNAFLTALNKQADIAKKGITAETLTMLRTRFILDWFEKDAAKFPFKLFDYQRQLLKEGNFNAYNQWLFGSVQNLAAFEAWTGNHSNEYKQFTTAQGGRMFKSGTGQYYQTTSK
ncbi:MAG: tetratricopeptide repeat protein [Chitinophagaceae bacterium]